MKNVEIKVLMKILASAFVALTLSASLARAETPSPPYDGSWESLQKMPVPAWFDDGKVGIFIHWGPYSAIGYRKGGRGYAEHVPKMIYADPTHYYPYLKQRWGAHPPEFGYKDIIPEFKAENWNPDDWAALFAEVGAKYVVFTAEHHDGWANWDSDLTPWNAVDKGPKRDLVGDLGKALRAKGLKYAPSYHRERHTGFFAIEPYVVHGEPRPDIVEEIRRDPEARMLYGPEFSYSKAYVDNYVARWKEIQEKYQPDMLWMDDFPIYTRDGNHVRMGMMKPEIKYFDDQVRGMITDFMNDGAARGAEVYVNNKGKNRNWPDGVGCLEKDNLKLNVIGPKWQSCTTFGTSFGYLQGDQYKSINSVIHEMIEVISRNGNFLVNIGPMADGSIAPPQLERLHAMGDWLRINGEAIYGTRYWKMSDQKNERLAFTTKGKKLYAIKLQQPSSPFVITGTAGWNAEQVKSVTLLGADSDVSWKMTPAGLQIKPPADLGSSQIAWSFEIVTDREQHVPNVIQKDATEALKGTKAVDLEGSVESAFSEIPAPNGTMIEVETAFAANGFAKLPVPPASGKTVMANRKTGHEKIETLVDGKLSESFGPIFGNAIHNGAYKMDLGSVQSIAAITSWSFNMKGFRGPQKLTLYGSDSATDPGWDLSNFTSICTIDTTGTKKASFTAASLRALEGQSIGQFRWIVWDVSPITEIGEKTAFQELAVELVPAAKRPNILYIVADDQAPFDLKIYDPKSALDTPVIDRLAAEGLVLDGAHQMGAWCGGVCTPSRHMIMSGRTLWHVPDKPNLARNPIAADPKHVPPNLADHTMAAVFNAAGYDTMRTCKKGNSYAAANAKFTVVHDSTKRGGTDESGSAWHAKQVLNYLDQRESSNDQDPFLIYFGFSHPHDTRDGKPELLAKYGAVNHRDKRSLPPANPKQPKLPHNYLPKHPFNNSDMNVRDEVNVSGVWTNRDERTIRNELGREFACSENIDIQIGAVLAKLKQMGELENTYIFYTSDHGMAIGRHGLQGKQNLYEHTFRVPYIVKGPGIKPGSRAVGNIYHLDTLATLCDLAGIETPKTSEGISFRSVLEGKKDTVREVLYGAYCGGAKPGMRCVKKGDWKLIRCESVEDGVSETQLFNLAENPEELLAEHHDPKVIALTGYTPNPKQINLASDPAYAGKLKEMEQILLDEMRDHFDPYRLSGQPDDGLNTRGSTDSPASSSEPAKNRKHKQLVN
ncbi:alpha-L-fucosidase [Stieleria sp. TO1_6]|uniref:alpha-L-fucosidase n=1 Tax=Stieleria tagensis TaxID=2956795 RepID=UPI00209AD8D2|nr:alpha-L-fucosidase [Stieleria tagensis]MCO8123099.1 alpha-L-fucosidase [Stieleria tagensis]